MPGINYTGKTAEVTPTPNIITFHSFIPLIRAFRLFNNENIAATALFRYQIRNGALCN